MKLSLLNEIHTSRDMIDVFRGYNHNPRIGEGEFYDMKNLTSTNYPLITPRPKRGVFKPLANPQGFIDKDSLCYVNGADFYVNDHRVAMELSTAPEDCPKTLISMGAYVIVMPDKKWIKTITNKEDETVFEHGNIEAEWDSQSRQADVHFEMCKADGELHENTVTNNFAPEITEEMKKGEVDIPLWLDTSSEPHSLKQYSTSMSTWTTVPTTYIKISASGIGEKFEVGDGVTISVVGTNSVELSEMFVGKSMVIYAKKDSGDDNDSYIVVQGILDKAITHHHIEGVISVRREMPAMDFIIESGNRLWGCRYGVANNGEAVNEIYASKLGDFKNWNCFAGISTDSYAATVGSDGQFTGAITHMGYPIFFKENYMHKVYGNYPANYQIQTTQCRGVQKGCHKSLAVVNEGLYYKARNGICAYDGSLPQEISAVLGEEVYSEAVAASHGNKYYISMHNDTANKWSLFVYDTAKGLWHKEDNLRVMDFCSCRGQLYFIDFNDPQKIKTMFGGKDDAEYYEWMAETGIIGTGYPDKKYISKLNVRMSLDIGSRAFFFIEYDSSGDWEFLFRMDGSTFKSFTIPIRPKRCDHMRLRIEGNGDFKIYSIGKTIEQGSDV
jgi:hypothetical protein